MSENKEKLQRKDRDLNITIKDLMQSQKLKMAVAYFEHFPELLEDIFTSLGESAQQAAKNVVISEYNKFGTSKKEKVVSEDGTDVKSVSGLAQYEMIPYLRLIKTFPRYNVWWKIESPIEKAIYLKDPNFKLFAGGRELLAKNIKETSVD